MIQKLWTAAFAALLLLTAATTCEAADHTVKPQFLRIITGPKGGQWHKMGEVMAKVLTEDVLAATSRVGGGVTNINAVNNKQADMALTLASFLGAARSGEAEYQTIQAQNVAVLANLFPQALYILIRRNVAEANGITSLGTLLRQKIPLRFASLKPGTASEFVLYLLLKYGYDTDFIKLRDQGWDVSFHNLTQIVENFMTEKLDCFAYVAAGPYGALSPIMEKHANMLALPVEQSVLDLMEQKFGTTTHVITPARYAFVSAPVRTLGDYTSLIVSADFPEDTVYSITKTLWSNKDKIASTVKDFGTLSPKTASPKGLPVHPGALKFWQSLADEK
ncbi:MAG: TAXI family TRAP transporter solute-binding subunit [Desulfovibrio sp.]|jgi:TRAP transporter TAXI family solute receptor|nr:TAXI family TRAP transporter solute-binding subunit [Desulfovibrio sp.]